MVGSSPTAAKSSSPPCARSGFILTIIEVSQFSGCVGPRPLGSDGRTLRWRTGRASPTRWGRDEARDAGYDPIAIRNSLAPHRGSVPQTRRPHGPPQGTTTPRTGQWAPAFAHLATGTATSASSPAPWTKTAVTVVRGSRVAPRREDRRQPPSRCPPRRPARRSSGASRRSPPAPRRPRCCSNRAVRGRRARWLRRR